MTEHWRDIPRSVLRQSELNEQSETWAQQQYAEVADLWGTLQPMPPDLPKGEALLGLGNDIPQPAAEAGSFQSPATGVLTAPSPLAVGGNEQSALSPEFSAPPVVGDLPRVDVGQYGEQPFGTARASGLAAQVPNQFGEPGLSTEEAYAACGPAAAVAFARAFGRNPTLRESLDLAKSTGWTAGGGMNGVGNQKALLDRMGIPSQLDPSGNWQTVDKAARATEPVIVSTPLHYFVVAPDPASGRAVDDEGRYFVGHSGTAFRGGKPWMSRREIEAIGGAINGALYTAGLAAQEGAGRALAGAGEAIGGAASAVGSAVGGALTAAQQATIGRLQTENSTGLEQGQRQYETQGFDAAPERTFETPGDELTPQQIKAIKQLTLEAAQGQYQTQGFDTPDPGAAITRGVGATLKNLDEQAAEGSPFFVPPPFRGPDPGRALSAGLTEAGVEGDVSLGPLTVPKADALGFAGGMVVPGGGKTAAVTKAQKAVLGKLPVAAEHGLTINLPKYVPEEVRAVIQNAYDANPQRFDAARRDVIPDDVVRDLAAQTGETIQNVVKRWKPGQTENAETILALREGLNAASQKVIAAQDALKQAPDSTDALAAFTRTLALHGAVQETVTGVTAEAGRALRQFRQPVTGADYALKQVQDLAKRWKVTPDELAEQLATVDLSDPGKVAGLARNMTQHTPASKLEALWYFSLLSSPVTHIKNVASNTLVTLTRPLETALAIPIDAAISKVTGRPRQRVMGEATAEMFGAAAGLRDGVQQAYQIMRRGFSDKDVGGGNLDLATKEAFKGRLADLTVNVPGRGLRAEDALFRTMNKNATIWADSLRIAKQEGHKGDALAARIAELRTNPTKEMLTHAEGEGAYRVFQSDGTLVNWLAKRPAASKAFLPFAQTPINIARYALERSPLGLVAIGKDAARGETGVLADRLSRVALGSLTMAAFGQYAGDGNLTASAPKDASERDAFFRQGKQPYSFRTPDGNWHSYIALQPFSTVIAASAVGADALRKGKDMDAFTLTTIMSLGIGQALLEQPWTQGLSEIMDLLSGARVREPEDVLKVGSDFAEQQVRAVVPALVRWLATSNDPTVRDPDGPWQAFLTGIPGASTTVPAKLDAFGKPIQRPITGTETLKPGVAFSPPANDPVEKELARLDLKGFDVEPGFVGRRIQAWGEPVQLRPEERRQYQEASGVLAYTLLAQAMQTKEWAGLSDQAKAKAVDRHVQNAREAIRTKLIPALKERALQQKQKAAPR